MKERYGDLDHWIEARKDVYRRRARDLGMDWDEMVREAKDKLS